MDIYPVCHEILKGTLLYNATILSYGDNVIGKRQIPDRMGA